MSIARLFGPLGLPVALHTAQALSRTHGKQRLQCQQDWQNETSDDASPYSAGLRKQSTLASKVWRAMRPGIVTNRFNPSQTAVIRVVLTGGPCAGKSSCLEHLRREATEAGYDVYLVPEVATLLLSNGVSVPSTSSAWFTFQNQILKLQLSLERTFTKIASSTGRPSIIIMDRGLLDGKSYVSEDTWHALMHATEASDAEIHQPRMRITEEYMIKRYDLVVHLVTAADGAEEHYRSGATTDDSGNKVVRGEPPDVARELDRKLRLAWAVHPNHCIIPNGSKGFTGKVEECTGAILNCANTLQPQPKYLKERVQALERETAELRKMLEISERSKHS
jgi:predicted ATPase